MDITTFFGLSTTDINFLAMLAQWFAAFGTIAAVIVALWLSFREKRVFLKIWAEKAVLVGGNESVEVLSITVINKGLKDTKIENFSWKIPFEKVMYYQNFNDITFPTEIIPILIREGERKSFQLRFEHFERNMKEIIEKRGRISRFKLKFMKIVVYTSVEKSFDRRIGKGLQKYITEQIENQ